VLEVVGEEGQSHLRLSIDSFFVCFVLFVHLNNKRNVTTQAGDCRVIGRGGSYLPLYVKAKTATSIKTKYV
jgi:hypothetical protein